MPRRMPQSALSSRPTRGRADASRVCFRGVLGVGLAAALSAPGALFGQTPPQPLRTIHADPLLPAGRVSLDFSPSYARWKSRFGRFSSNGTTVNGRESLAADLNDPTTTSVFPGVDALRESLRSLADNPDYQPVLGATSAAITEELTRIDAGVRVGVFDWLTVGVDVPFVRSRSSVELGFVPSPDANVGLNPNADAPASVSSVLVSLEDAASAAGQRAMTVCGQGAGATCDDAQALADRVATFRDLARTAYLSSAFFPVEGTTMADALQAALGSLNEALSAAGLSPAAASLAFASAPLTADELASVPEDPSIGQTAIGSMEKSLWKLGDVEISGAVRLLDGEVRDSGAVSPRLAWTVVGGGLLRLATGVRDDPAISFDQGSGDGQMDLEGRVDAILRVGTHLDVRGSGRYGVQRSTTLLRHVAPHEEVFPPASTLRAVQWTPGNYQLLFVSPRWHLTEALSLAMDLQAFHKGQDQYVLAGPQPADAPAVNPADLERETSMNLVQMAFGLRYSTVSLNRRGLSNTPVELAARLVQSVRGSGGNVPAAIRAEFSLSILKRFWGR